jgi:hypothetical protein
MKTELSLQMFGKFSDIKQHDNPSCGSSVALCGRTDGRSDRYYEANSRFSHIANVPKRHSAQSTNLRLVLIIGFDIEVGLYDKEGNISS